MNLPKVYQNRNIGSINNDQEYFYSATSEITATRPKATINIDNKINNLFKSNKYIYKIKVNIRTTAKDFETTIIGKMNNNLITLDNELIPIKDIIDINEK